MKRRIRWVGLGAWVALLAGGMGWSMRYQATAGAAGAGVATWPAGSGVERSVTGDTVVMIAHPRCPCTRASLVKLRELIEAAAQPPTTTVVFVVPPGEGEGFAQTATFRDAQAIPGVRVLVDRGGAEARRFGAETSGDLLIFDRGGRAVFHGGITASRDEVGPSLGARAALAALEGHAPQVGAPVFGCSLLSPRRSEVENVRVSQ